MTTQINNSLRLKKIMNERIDVAKAMEGSPRPHYLIGEAFYFKEGNIHRLRAKVNFSSEGNPSISDRAKKYLPMPHINVGDVCFAVWNTAHIMGDKEKYTKRILKDEVVVKIGQSPIPPDTVLDLETITTEGRVVSVPKRGMNLYDGTLQGVLSLKGEILAQVNARYYAEKQQNT